MSEFGGPVRPKPLGPSQPSMPTVAVRARTSPNRVRSRSEMVRIKSRSIPAIMSSARPMRGAIPSSVALLYSSSTIIVEMLLTCSGPSSSSASLSIRLSASATRSSPVSRRRTMAMATSVPSVSVPVSASSAARSAGGAGASSTCCRVTDSKLST